MRTWWNLNVATKIILCFAVPLVLILWESIYVFSASNSVISKIENVHGISVANTLLAKQMQLEVAQIQRWITGASLTGEADALEKVQEHLDALLADVEQLRRDSGAGLDLLSGFGPAVRSYHSLGVKMSRAYLSGDVGEGNRLMAAFDAEAARLSAILEQLYLAQNDSMGMRAQVAADDLNYLGYGALIVGVLFVFVGAASTWLLTKSVTPPLERACNIAEGLSRGELGEVGPVGRGDELGRLLNAQAGMVNKLRQIVFEIKVATDSVMNDSEEVSSASSRISDGSETQAELARQVAASMDEMTDNIRHNADDASSTGRISGKVATDARGGGEAVDETLRAMQIITEKVSVIRDIARQTNLLSLNAAVEASAAGDAGRGFAVVATEVQKLAEKSALAVKEISEVSSASLEVAENAREKLHQVVPGIESTSELVANISAACSEQSGGAQQINEALKRFDTAIQSNVAMVHGLNDIAGRLETQAHTLGKAVGFFVLDEDGPASRKALPPYRG